MDLISELTKQGFLGAIAGGELIAIIYLFKKYIEQLELRRTDAVTFRDALKEPMTNLQQTLNAIVAILQKAGQK